MKTALLQLTSSDQPTENLITMRAMMRDAVRQGAGFVLSPEVCNCVSSSRTHQMEVLQDEASDLTLSGLRTEVQALGIWMLVGSLAIRQQGDDARFVNRSYLIAPDGEIAARYDKIHMFDVQVTPEETYRESDGYRPGERAVVADAGFARIGLTVCYDVRFPYLHRALARAGADILTVPAAFSHATGPAHWEVLLRARAIETGCFVLAPAQCGQHSSGRGAGRRTHGHSMIINPWGEVLANGGTEPEIVMADIDLAQVALARHKVPSLTHDSVFLGPM